MAYIGRGISNANCSTSAPVCDGYSLRKHHSQPWCFELKTVVCQWRLELTAQDSHLCTFKTKCCKDIHRNVPYRLDAEAPCSVAHTSCEIFYLLFTCHGAVKDMSSFSFTWSCSLTPPLVRRCCWWPWWPPRPARWPSSCPEGEHRTHTHTQQFIDEHDWLQIYCVILCREESKIDIRYVHENYFFAIS